MKRTGNSIDSEKMKRAELLYRRRQAGLDMPDGHYTRDIFQLSKKEWQPCCRNIMIGDDMHPIRAKQHAKSKQHIANLCGVRPADFIKYLKTSKLK
ncbi:TPA: hypothetical protein ACQJJO_004475 [Aeromonas veronii]